MNEKMLKVTTTNHPSKQMNSQSNSRNNRKRCEICLKLKKKTLERHRSHVFITIFEHISYFFSVLIVYFEQVNICWSKQKVALNVLKVNININLSHFTCVFNSQKYTLF